MNNLWNLTDFKSIPFCNTYSLYALPTGNKFDLTGAPTFSRLTTTSPTDTNQMYWLIFSYSKGVLAFLINHIERRVTPVESIGDIFPALEIGQLPGSAIRSHCWVSNNYRFSVVGYDTGYVIASVCTMHSGNIIDRKTIKFSGPISVLRLINQGDEELTTSVLVSSTLGPAAIWNLKLDDEVLIWEMKTVLLNSEIYDAVITCAISRYYAFIGTYGEQLLVYSTADLLSVEFCEVFPLFILNIASPIISIVFLETKRLLIVLSYKGVHTFSACCPPHEMLMPLYTSSSPEPTGMISSPITHSFSGTKSPLISPTVEVALSMSNWQLPISAPVISATQNLVVLKPQSYSLPQSNSSPPIKLHQHLKTRPHFAFTTPPNKLSTKQQSNENDNKNQEVVVSAKNWDDVEVKAKHVLDKEKVGSTDVDRPIETLTTEATTKKLLK